MGEEIERREGDEKKNLKKERESRPRNGFSNFPKKNISQTYQVFYAFRDTSAILENFRGNPTFSEKIIMIFFSWDFLETSNDNGSCIDD